jgi:uncharacterized protein (UPF0254 family)
LLAILLGCGLRRRELTDLAFGQTAAIALSRLCIVADRHRQPYTKQIGQ